MSLQLENILVTGRTYEEYMAFFEDLKGKKVLDCPSGASSFVKEANEKGAEASGVDLIYAFAAREIRDQGRKTIEKIYEDISWMDGFSFGFYGSIENHRKQREEALESFCKDFNCENYIHGELPKLDYEDGSFDLVLSSHLLFTYDDRFSYQFHKDSILEMLRVGKEVRLFPLVDFKNSRVGEERNFSPFVYRFLEDLKGYNCEIIKVDFEFQPGAGYMLKITKDKS